MSEQDWFWAEARERLRRKSLEFGTISPIFIWGIFNRDQARGRLGRNGRPGGRNFALKGTQGEVGVSLKKKKFFFFFFFFFRETHFHSVTTQMQAVVTLSDNLLPLHRVSPSIKMAIVCVMADLLLN